jgi:hypothetical protein
MDSSSLRRLRSSLACTGDLRRACAFRRLSSRAVCNPCGFGPPFMHSTRRRYNSRACAFLLYPPVFLPGYYLQLSLQVTPVSLASAFQLPACAFGCALWPCFQRASGLRLLPIFHADWRPASTLIACRTPTRPQCNSRLAPQATRLWLRRRFNLWLAPDVASFG